MAPRGEVAHALECSLEKSRMRRLKSHQEWFRMRGSTGMSSDAPEFAVAKVAGVLDRKVCGCLRLTDNKSVRIILGCR